MQRTGSKEITEILSFAKMQNILFTNFFFHKFLIILIFNHFIFFWPKSQEICCFPFGGLFVCLGEAGGGGY